MLKKIVMSTVIAVTLSSFFSLCANALWYAFYPSLNYTATKTVKIEELGGYYIESETSSDIVYKFKLLEFFE